MIRKEGKARWIYECAPCNHTRASVDQFRAIEAKQSHERGAVHLWGVIAAAVSPIAAAYMALGKSVIAATEQYKSDFALVPPMNIPHDPALIRDRRKWGGK